MLSFQEFLLYLLLYNRWNASDHRMRRYISSYYTTCCHNAMFSYSYTWQYDSICPNPYIIGNRYRYGKETLPVNHHIRIIKLMIKGCHRNILSQIDMVTYRHRTDNGITYPHPRLITYHNIAYGVVDTTS